MSFASRLFFRLFVLAAAAPSLPCGSAVAATTTIYTSQASFLAAVQPGYYNETFTGSRATAPSYDYSGGSAPFAYSVSAPHSRYGNDVYLSGTFIANYYFDTSLTVVFTSGSPTAVGGNFYLTDASDAFVEAAPVTIALSDGTTTTFVPAGVDAFRGFTSTAVITSLVFSAPGASRFNTIDNLIVGTAAAVPEPGCDVLMAGGLAALAAAMRRRFRHAPGKA